MKTITILLASLLLILFGTSKAQTSAGNSFFIDYDTWNASSKPPVYINCGSSNTFNTGQELTMEVWIRIYNSAWNQKIMGKVNNLFNSGYVQAMEVGKNYSEVWTPNHIEIKDGTIPIDSAWVHLATTYAAGGQLIAYVNGIEVGNVVVANAPISANNDPFIIGMAPWDLISYQTFGYIDEVRIWSVARSAAEINETMHKHLEGNEAGLVAYYDFNQTSGSTLPDLTANANHGTIAAGSMPYGSWQTSYAAVGDNRMYPMMDVNAIWFGKDPLQYNYATTTNGLNIVGNILNKHPEYAVYGHNDSAGVSTSYLPANASADFKRLNREWFFNKGGSINADLYFNLTTAAAGGTMLAVNQTTSYYTLLERDSLNQTFTAVASASSLLAGGTVIKFSGAALENKFYTIGVGSTQLVNAISENNTWETKINIYPNPATRVINLTNVAGTEINLYNTLGELLKTVKTNEPLFSMNVNDFETGIYFIQLTKGNLVTTKRFIIQK